MGIYHTVTQEAYNALMLELEKQGCTWQNSMKPTSKNTWTVYKDRTCVRVNNNRLTYNHLDYFVDFYPAEEIVECVGIHCEYQD